MQHYLLRNLSELAQRRAILMREEAQLWNILSRELKIEAGRLEDTPSGPVGRPRQAQLPPEKGRLDKQKLLVGIAEPARMIGISRSTLYKEIGASRLRVRKAGKRTLIAVADIQNWWASLAEWLHLRFVFFRHAVIEALNLRMMCGD
ncbi:hypothetical protein ASG47_19860 [Devosia sp. Leaf420]|uniref:helix-turn-helix domain-containing protein n=1 Tax=Devosia sp. Leaf420 TaxID=1736374 RepID=UPI00071263E7|nr:helix-turn-helix domain-containing protein [Devosia sp. Leaf420]KQT50246.1 hypothetical protein ASG47_19860 [Devosia sp. Leaf420]